MIKHIDHEKIEDYEKTYRPTGGGNIKISQ